MLKVIPISVNLKAAPTHICTHACTHTPTHTPRHIFQLICILAVQERVFADQLLRHKEALSPVIGHVRRVGGERGGGDEGDETAKTA